MPAFGVSPTLVSAESQGGTVEPGDDVTVSVSIANNPGFAAAVFSFSYDHSALELRSLNNEGTKFGEYAGGGLISYDFSNNDTVGYVNTALSDLTGDGVLFKLTFRVKTGAVSGSYSVSPGVYRDLAENFVNDNKEALPVSFQSGSVQVAAVTPPPDNPPPEEPGDSGSGTGGTGGTGGAGTNTGSGRTGTGGTGAPSVGGSGVGTGGTGSGAGTANGTNTGVDEAADESPIAGGNSASNGNVITREDIAQSPTPLSSGDTGGSALQWLWIFPALAVIGGGLAIFRMYSRRRNRE
jgi:hypothetical protein